MRRHKILSVYCKQATALCWSEMHTCRTVTDVSNLETDLRSIQNVHPKRSKQRPSQHISEAEATPVIPRIPAKDGAMRASSPDA